MQMISEKAGTASPYTNRMNVTYGYQASAGQMGTGSTAGNAGQLVSVSGTINCTTESASYTYDDLWAIDYIGLDIEWNKRAEKVRL